MKKTHDTTKVESELKESAFFRQKSTQQSGQTPTNPEVQPTNQSASQSVSQLANQLVSSSVSKPANQLVNSPIGMKCFYIIGELSDRIDQAVEYFKTEKKLKNVDRSIVLTALLSKDNQWSSEALDQLTEKVLEALTTRAVSR